MTVATRLRPSGFIDACLPTIGRKPPSGPQWVHEIKQDGYRLIARRAGERVRLFTRRGFDWADRYPRIVEAMATLEVASATIDGEAVWCGEDGISDFDKVHGRTHDHQVFLYCFDLLELDGADLRETPLIERKRKLAKLLVRAGDVIRLSEHHEGDGATIFEHPCRLGLEGIVSKRRDLPYVSGRAKCWIKVRNPASAAMHRYEKGTF
jgi:bifunctional non-homologous end joining protein LigD